MACCEGIIWSSNPTIYTVWNSSPLAAWIVISVIMPSSLSDVLSRSVRRAISWRNAVSVATSPPASASWLSTNSERLFLSSLTFSCLALSSMSSPWNISEDMPVSRMIRSPRAAASATAISLEKDITMLAKALNLPFAAPDTLSCTASGDDMTSHGAMPC